jgi:hypothetical protein
MRGDGHERRLRCGFAGAIGDSAGPTGDLAGSSRDIAGAIRARVNT